MFAKLCTKSISALGWDNEKVISADADHVRMSMFPNRTDAFFDSLMSNLSCAVNQTVFHPQPRSDLSHTHEICSRN